MTNDHVLFPLNLNDGAVDFIVSAGPMEESCKFGKYQTNNFANHSVNIVNIL